MAELSAKLGRLPTQNEIDDLVICPVDPDRACVETPGSKDPRVFVPLVSIKQAKLAVTRQNGRPNGWGIDGTYKVGLRKNN